MVLSALIAFVSSISLGAILNGSVFSAKNPKSIAYWLTIRSLTGTAGDSEAGICFMEIAFLNIGAKPHEVDVCVEELPKINEDMFLFQVKSNNRKMITRNDLLIFLYL